MGYFSHENIRFTALLVFVLIAGSLLFLFRMVLTPFLMALLVAYLLAPLVDYLCQPLPKALHRFRRAIAIVVVYTVIIGLLTLGGLFAFPRFTAEVNRLIKELPQLISSFEQDLLIPAQSWLEGTITLPEPLQPLNPSPIQQTARQPRNELERFLTENRVIVSKTGQNEYGIVLEDPSQNTAEANHNKKDLRTWIVDNMRLYVQSDLLHLLNLGGNYIRIVFDSVFAVFLTLMIAGFILIDIERILNFARSLIPQQHVPRLNNLVKALDRGLNGVIRGQLIICLVNGVLTGIGLFIFEVPFAITLTIIATVLSLIPIFGVLISTVPIVLLALNVSLYTAVAIFIWIVAIHLFEANIINPKIIGSQAHLHPVLIFFALIAGEQFAGLIGAILAVPTLSLIRSSFYFILAAIDAAEATASASQPQQE